MNQTANYGLNQWAAQDRIMMQDFNGDNAKIDAALKAVAEANPYRKILSVVTQAAAQQIDLDVSGIDFTQYHKIELFVDSPGMAGGYTLLVNGKASSQYTTGSLGSTGGGTNYANYLATVYTSPGYGIVLFYPPTAGKTVGCVYMSFDGTSYTSGQLMSRSVTWSALTAFNLVGGAAFPAGTKIQIFGVKK